MNSKDFKAAFFLSPCSFLKLLSKDAKLYVYSVILNRLLFYVYHPLNVYRAVRINEDLMTGIDLVVISVMFKHI